MRESITDWQYIWLSESSLNALAIVDDGLNIRVVRTVGVLGDKKAMASLERMEKGDVVGYVTAAIQ